MITLSPIPNKAPKLYTEICSEMNNVSVTVKCYCKMKVVALGSCFLRKLLAIIGKRFCDGITWKHTLNVDD